MKKRKIIWILILIIIFEIFTPTTSYAKQLWAFTKEEIPCYSDAYGSSRAGSIPGYTGFYVKEKGSSYYLVTYQKKGKRKTGWISKEDYRDICLQYDGSEIAVIADGVYTLGGQQITITFLGNEEYQIQLTKTKQFFSSDQLGLDFVLSDQEDNKANIWKLSRDNHKLLIQHKISGKYLIINGSVIQMGGYQEACKSQWSLVREGTNVNPYRNFCQYDGRWGGKKYGSSTKMAQAGCGVLVVVNAIYALNGQYMDPMQGAEYACETGYRVPYSGTDEGYLRAVIKNLGEQYGVSYAGKVETISGMKQCLQEGAVLAAHVQGHYVAIVDYDKKKDKFLVLDSHPLPKRKTSPFGSWVSSERLVSGSLCVSAAYKYIKVKDTGFIWNLDMQKINVIQKLSINLNPGSDFDTMNYLMQMKGNHDEKVE